MDQQELLTKVGNWISETAQQIGDFAAKEIPPFITEYLTWKFWENVTYISVHFVAGIGIILFTTIMWMLIKLMWKKHGETKFNNWNEGAISSTIFSIIAIGILTIFWIIKFPLHNIMNCIQIKIAPKVYLVEKAAELYKTNK